MIWNSLSKFKVSYEVTSVSKLHVKSESKKIGHILLLIIWWREPSEYIWIRRGQNDLFQALKWGVVRLSTSNSFRDMTKDKVFVKDNGRTTVKSL